MILINLPTLCGPRPRGRPILMCGVKPSTQTSLRLDHIFRRKFDIILKVFDLHFGRLLAPKSCRKSYRNEAQKTLRKSHPKVDSLGNPGRAGRTRSGVPPLRTSPQSEEVCMKRPARQRRFPSPCWLTTAALAQKPYWRTRFLIW